MLKPSKEQFGYKDGKFPDTNSMIRYNLQNGKYLAFKRKENKQKLLDEVVQQIMSDMYNYKQVIQECLYESFNKCPQHELKTWL